MQFPMIPYGEISEEKKVKILAWIAEVIRCGYLHTPPTHVNVYAQGATIHQQCGHVFTVIVPNLPYQKVKPLPDLDANWLEQLVPVADHGHAKVDLNAYKYMPDWNEKGWGTQIKAAQEGTRWFRQS